MSSRDMSDEDEFEDAVDEQTGSNDDLDGAMGKLGLEEVALEKTLAGAKGLKLRQALPSNDNRGRFGFWAFLKSAVGKDLSKIAMPVVFNEPLSFLQRMAEDMEYAELLDKAAEHKDPGMRAAFVAALTVTVFSTTTDARVGKPFNPLLAETFEYVNYEKKYRYISEQVSHHPPISACHCESDKWEFWQEYTAEMKFRGNFIKLVPSGAIHVRLKTTGEHFSTFKPTTYIHNLIVGKLWVDHEGDIVVRNHSTGGEAVVQYSTYSSVGRDYRNLKGWVANEKGEKTHIISGAWDKNLACKQAGKQDAVVVDLWQKDPMPANNNAKQFGFTPFAMGLNEPHGAPHDTYAQTDCRRRPDMRLFEDGDVGKAADEKYRLEEKQRAYRRRRQEQNITHSPRWFEKREDADTGKVLHVYKGGYWEAKEKGDFGQEYDIF